MKNKLLISMASLASIVAPVAAISCSCSSKSTEEAKASTNPNPPVVNEDDGVVVKTKPSSRPTRGADTTNSPAPGPVDTKIVPAPKPTEEEVSTHHVPDDVRGVGDDEVHTIDPIEEKVVIEFIPPTNKDKDEVVDSTGDRTATNPNPPFVIGPKPIPDANKDRTTTDKNEGGDSNQWPTGIDDDIYITTLPEPNKDTTSGRSVVENPNQETTDEDEEETVDNLPVDSSDRTTVKTTEPETKEDDTVKSKFFEIKGNTLFFDITKSKKDREAFAASAHFKGAHNVPVWLNTNFRDESAQALEWFNSEREKGSSIKFALVYYLKEKKYTNVIRINLYDKPIKTIHRFKDLYTLYFNLKIWAEENQQFVKTSNNIADFHNAEW